MNISMNKLYIINLTFFFVANPTEIIFRLILSNSSTQVLILLIYKEVPISSLRKS